MKKYLMILAAVPLMLVSCGIDGPESGGINFPNTDNGLSHDMIVLGDRLDNPYKTENVRKAFSSLYPTKAADVVQTTNLYVRFLPKDQSEFEVLGGLGVEMLDHPVDYEIITEGDYYHDPTVGNDNITWQYAVVPKDFKFPDIKYQIIHECFIADNSTKTRAGDGIDWEAVEMEAYRISGNEEMIDKAATKAGIKVCPSGRITIADSNANGGQSFGVAGVCVSCNTFVKFATAYTDRDGYYTMPKSFSSQLRYRLVFKNEKGFSIGMNLILVPASTSTLGKAPAEGINYTITEQSESKLFKRSTVNNAAYDYISRCSTEDMNIANPPGDLRIWLFKGLSASSAVMMHHGAIVKNSQITRYLGVFSSLIQYFAPDITIGTKNHNSYMELYDSVCHELAHASHFNQVGKDYWDQYIYYIMESYLKTGGETYGEGDGPYAGHCEVGEMWAYYVESMMHKERYGGKVPAYGTSYWFYPQIFRYLEDRGLSRSDIFASLSEDVSGKDALRKRLIELYPKKKIIIEQVFNRYR